MTPAQLHKKALRLDLKKFEADGVDIGLLLSALAKTPTERVEDNNEMLQFIDEARKSRLGKPGANSPIQKNTT